MKLITRFELASKTTNELHALYRETFNSMVLVRAGSQERDNAKASLENIQRELILRL